MPPLALVHRSPGHSHAIQKKGPWHVAVLIGGPQDGVKSILVTVKTAEVELA